MHVDVKFNMYFGVSGESHIQVDVCINTMCKYTQNTCLCACTRMYVDVKFNMYFRVPGESHVQLDVCVDTRKAHVCVHAHSFMLM